MGAALRLPPNMPTLPKLTNENLEYEDQLSKTKLRYSRRTTGSLKEQEEDARGGLDQVQEQTPEEVIKEHSHREFYCPDTKMLDFGKLRTTDLRNNNRIYLPKPRPPQEESILETKSVLYRQTFDNYKDLNCNNKGQQNDEILTPQELKGIEKLKVREKAGEIILP